MGGVSGGRVASVRLMVTPRLPRRLWTATEVERLLGWTGSDEELAASLGRSVRAISAKRRALLDPAGAAVARERGRARANRRALIYQRTHREAFNAVARARTARDRAAATASGPYTAAEDEVVMRVELTAGDVARRLGRTRSSVKQRRQKLRNRRGEEGSQNP